MSRAQFVAVILALPTVLQYAAGHRAKKITTITLRIKRLVRSELYADHRWLG